MAWLEEDLKIVVAGLFVLSQIEQEVGETQAGRLSVRVVGSLLFVTSRSGVSVTLAYNEEMMAALWGLRILTEQTEGVLGAIQQANLTTLSLPFWPNFAATPDRADLLSRMRRAARYGNQHYKKFKKQSQADLLSGVPPEPREHWEM